MQLRRRLLLQGELLFTATLLAGLLLAVLSDWWLQPNGNSRWLAPAGLCLLALGLGWKWLLGPWLRPVSLTDIALQLERTQPQWQGQLAAWVELSARGALPQAVAAPRAAVGASLRWRPLLWAALPLALIVVSWGLLIGQSPQLVQVAIARTFLPHEPIRWPRTTELQLLTGQGTVLAPSTTLRIDARQPLTLYVRDLEGDAPKSILWEVKHASGKVERIQVERTEVSSRRFDFRYTWLPSNGASWVRVAGGDFRSMGWCPLEAVTAPVITSMQVELVYPDYLAQEPRVLSALPVKLGVPIGTQIRVQGVLDRAVASVRLMALGSTAQPLTLSAAGDTFQWEARIESADRKVFWFEVSDAAGLSAARPPRHELVPLVDAFPEARLTVPDADVYVTADAELPLTFLVRDDHGLKQVQLRAETGETVANLWTHEWTPGETAEMNLNAVLYMNAADVASTNAVATVPQIQGPVAPLAVGAEVRLELQVADFAPGEERWSSSPIRVLRIVSADEKLHELEQRVLAKSEQLREHVDALARCQDELRSVPPEFTENVQISQWYQTQYREYQRLLNQAANLLRHEQSVVSAFLQIQVEATANKLLAERLAQPLGAVITRLQDLERQELVLTENELQRVNDHINEVTNESFSLDEWLHPATSEVARLELAGKSLLHGWQEVLNSLAHWERQRDYLEQFDELYAKFGALRSETLPVAQRTVAVSAAQLSGADRATLAELSTRHHQLAADYQHMQQQRFLPTANHSLFVETQQRLSALQPTQTLQEIADLLARNNIGQGLQRQAELLRNMEALHQILHGDSQPAETVLLERLTQSQQQAEEMLIKQQQLSQDVLHVPLSDAVESREQLARLIKSHEELLLSSEQLSRELRQLGVTTAATQMAQAADELRQSRFAVPEQRRADALGHLQRAEQFTQQTVDALQRMASRLAQESLDERLQEVGRMLQALSQRQLRLAVETQRLRTVFEEKGRWSRGELKTLVDQAEFQNRLAEELTAQRLQLVDLSLFQVVTDELVKSMQHCVGELQQRSVSTKVEDTQRQVAEKLTQLADALNPQTPTAAPTETPTATPPSATASATAAVNSRPGLSASQTAELRLIAALQLEIANRTEQLLADATLSTADRTQQIEQLTREQQRLADWLEAILLGDRN